MAVATAKAVSQGFTRGRLWVACDRLGGGPELDRGAAGRVGADVEGGGEDAFGAEDRGRDAGGDGDAAVRHEVVEAAAVLLRGRGV